MNTEKESEFVIQREFAKVLASSELLSNVNIGIPEKNGSSTADSGCVTEYSESSANNKERSNECTGSSITLGSGTSTISSGSSTEDNASSTISSGSSTEDNASSTISSGSSTTLSSEDSTEDNESSSDDSESSTISNGSSNKSNESTTLSNESSNNSSESSIVSNESSSDDSESSTVSSSSSSDGETSTSDSESSTLSSGSSTLSSGSSTLSSGSSTLTSGSSTLSSGSSTLTSRSSTLTSRSSTLTSRSSTLSSGSVNEYHQRALGDDEKVTENFQNAIESSPVTEEQPMLREIEIYLTAAKNYLSSTAQNRSTIRFCLKSCLLAASKFLDIFLAISALFMGGLYKGYCPASWLLPWCLILIGSGTAATLIYVWVLMSFEDYQIPGMVWKLHYFILGTLFLIECFLFYLSTDSTNNPASDNYCSSIFFYYTANFSVLMPFAIIWSHFDE